MADGGLGRWVRAGWWLLAGSRWQRRRVRQELARLLLRGLGGFYLGEDHKAWLADDHFHAECTAHGAGHYDRERKFVLREYARQLRDVPGAMAECGCYRGASAWFMARELPGVPLYLFDSFAGLSPPGGEDRVSDDQVFSWQEGDLAASEEEVRANLAGVSPLHLLSGWIPDRFDEVTDQRFRLVHIDVDLYAPTLASLAFFYPRLSAGGVMVLDDYGFLTCPGVRQAVNDYLAERPERVLHLPTGQGVIVRQGG